MDDGQLDELLHDIFTTALEGGIGYWSECHAYHWAIDIDGPDGSAIDDTQGFFADIFETGDGDIRVPWRIDREVIKRGWELACTDEWRRKIGWSSEKPCLNCGWDDFDAGDADCVVQLGLFADVVYG